VNLRFDFFVLKNQNRGGERHPKRNKNFLCLTLKKRTRLKSDALVTKTVVNGGLIENRVDMKSAAIPLRAAALWPFLSFVFSHSCALKAYLISISPNGETE